MEWIRISSNKLKIMLSAKDAERYELACESADLADAVTRTAFREILTDIKKETDFDATEDKVYIQMYPSKEGGCELFVTKIGLLFGEESAMNANSAQKTSKKTKSLQKRRAAFAFFDFDGLLAVCRRLSDSFSGESEVWRDERGKWWLLLSEMCESQTAKERFRFIRDYAEMHSFEDKKMLLPEHGSCICKRNAVAVLGALSK